MIEYPYKTMDVMDYLLISTKKIFFVKQIILILSLIRTAFFVKHINLENVKHFKKISKELMAIACHLNRWWYWYMS